MKKLFFIYTNPRFLTALYEPVMARAFGDRKDLEVFFLCDTSILADALKNDGVPDESVERRLNHLIDNCIEGGADCVVVGCTVMNTAAEKLAPSKPVPVFSIDRPMIAHVAEDGVKKAAVLTHALDNGQTIERQLKKCGVDCRIFVIPDAARANQAGDRALLQSLYRSQAEKLGDEFDAVVLGHISADDVEFGQTQGRVYRSGRLCVEEIERILERKGEKA